MSARSAEFGYNHFISNKREWNNCFIKNAPKYRKLDYNKSKKAQKTTHTLTIFVDHGIINNSHTPLGAIVKLTAANWLFYFSNQNSLALYVM